MLCSIDNQLGVMYNMTSSLAQSLFLTKTVTIYRDILTLSDENIVLTKLDVILHMSFIPVTLFHEITSLN